LDVDSYLSKIPIKLKERLWFLRKIVLNSLSFLWRAKCDDCFVITICNSPRVMIWTWINVLSIIHLWSHPNRYPNPFICQHLWENTTKDLAVSVGVSIAFISHPHPTSNLLNQVRRFDLPHFQHLFDDDYVSNDLSVNVEYKILSVTSWFY
jgi:hypothetical protein